MDEIQMVQIVDYIARVWWVLLPLIFCSSVIALGFGNLCAHLAYEYVYRKEGEWNLGDWLNDRMPERFRVGEWERELTWIVLILVFPAMLLTVTAFLHILPMPLFYLVITMLGALHAARIGVRASRKIMAKLKAHVEDPKAHK